MEEVRSLVPCCSSQLSIVANQYSCTNQILVVLIEYRFGSYDPERIDGELTWCPVTIKRYWQIKCDGLFFGDVDLQLSSDVIVDTGKSLLFLLFSYVPFIALDFLENIL